MKYAELQRLENEARQAALIAVKRADKAAYSRALEVQQTVNQQDLAQQQVAAAEATGDLVKKYLPWVLGGIALVAVAVVVMKKRKSSGRK